MCSLYTLLNGTLWIITIIRCGNSIHVRFIRKSQNFSFLSSLGDIIGKIIYNILNLLILIVERLLLALEGKN